MATSSSISLVPSASLTPTEREEVENIFATTFDAPDPKAALSPFFDGVDKIFLARDAERIVGFQFYQERTVEGCALHHFSLAGRVDDPAYRGIQSKFGLELIRQAVLRTPPWKSLYIAGVTNSPVSYANMRASGGICFPDVLQPTRGNPFGSRYLAAAEALGMHDVTEDGLLLNRMDGLGFGLRAEGGRGELGDAYDQYVGGEHTTGIFVVIELVPARDIPRYLAKRSRRSLSGTFSSLTSKSGSSRPKRRRLAVPERKRSMLDVVAFQPLDADKYMTRVTNEDLLTFAEERLAPQLSEEHQVLYKKLLQVDRSRYLAVDRLDEPLDDDYRKRYERYRRQNGALATQCVTDLLSSTGVKGSEISAVVSNNTVGGMIPNLTSTIGNAIGLDPRARVIDIGYMGCATSLLALELIEQQLRPGQLGVIVSSELTSVMANPVAESTASLVANTVFGDGVGAFLVVKRPHRRDDALMRIIGHSGSILTDDEALGTITYEPNDVYHEIQLHDGIPDAAGRGVRLVMEDLVRRHLTSPAEKLQYAMRGKMPRWQQRIDAAVLHTAGTRVLESLVDSLELSPDQVAHNFAAFRRYGNTSSASMYYALDELRKHGGFVPGNTVLMLAFGSGFFTRGCLFEVLRSLPDDPSSSPAETLMQEREHVDA